VVRDVTDQKLAEDRRLKLERKMLDAQRLESLGVMAGGIAHDFNNLLTSILGNATLVMMQLPEQSPLRSCLTAVEKSALDAADLCKQMLAYSGRGRSELKRTCINGLLQDMNHLLQVSIHKQIILRFQPYSRLPAVRAEPAELQQIVMNLVINASEAIGSRNGLITVSTGVVQADRIYLEESFFAPDLPEGDYVFLEVQDTGAGMTPETQARIFDPFFTTKFTGRGLGLAAVRGILQRHHGTLRVESALNVGSTFRVMLPAVTLASQEATPAAREPRGWSGRGSVLVADDEPAVRAVMATLLERCGLTVLLAKDGGEAVDLFRRHLREIDLVILDMTMPVMGGSEAFREIRQLRPEQKVLLMSGYTESDAIDRFGEKGLSGFLQKPFRVAQLEEKLRQLLPQ
jgi:two-component system, cell cycle sensor histidine kinase and response regulator CckA